VSGVARDPSVPEDSFIKDARLYRKRVQPPKKKSLREEKVSRYTDPSQICEEKAEAL
jgi:hypothetical protein